MLKIITFLLFFMVLDMFALTLVCGLLSVGKKFDEEAEEYFMMREKNRLYNEGDEDSLR